MYENDTGSGPSGRRGIDLSGDETILNLQRANEQQMTLLAGMIKHMQQEAERTARSAEQTAQLAQKREDRESLAVSKKNFAEKAAKLPRFMQPPMAKVFFGGKSVTEVSTAQLRKYFETVASFVETVDHEAGQLNALIKAVCRYTYRPSVRDAENNGVESMVAIATENYKNIQACHTKGASDKLIEYGNLSISTQELDEEMYHFVSSQFDPTGSEMVQYRARTKEHPQLTLYSELMLYLFHTKAGSPIHMWSNQQNEISELERRVPTDIRTVSMSAMRESFGALLDELEVNILEPWQVAVVKLHAHAVRTGCKDTTHALELNVLNFLSGAQDGDEVKVPNVRDWANRTMDGIEQTKEYYDARMSSRKGPMKATAPAAQETTKPSDTTKPVQAFDQSNWVPGKCVKCKREFRGPPVDRQGGDPTKTWFKLCRACKSSDGSVGKFKGETKDVHQVEKVTSTDDHCDEGPPDVYGPCDMTRLMGVTWWMFIGVNRNE